MCKFWFLVIPILWVSADAFGAEPSDANSFPPVQCMNQCELAGTCREMKFEDFPDFEAAKSDIGSNCQAKYLLYAIEGACSNGRKILRTGNGFTSEIKLYTEQGNFEGLITQTDVIAPPCMGQSFWPEYLQCDAPTVVTSICGIRSEIGSPAFQSRWDE